MVSTKKGLPVVYCKRKAMKKCTVSKAWCIYCLHTVKEITMR